MEKKIQFLIGGVVLALIILILILSFIFASSSSKNSYLNVPRSINPISNLTFEEAVERFNESFVLYFLESIGVNKLHNPPFSSNTPKIEIYIGEDIYNAEVIKGKINVSRGLIENEDLIVRTTKEEGVFMLINISYVETSFNNGKSSIELSSSELDLLSKGYAGIYNKFK